MSNKNDQITSKLDPAKVENLKFQIDTLYAVMNNLAATEDPELTKYINRCIKKIRRIYQPFTKRSRYAKLVDFLTDVDSKVAARTGYDIFWNPEIKDGRIHYGVYWVSTFGETNLDAYFDHMYWSSFSCICADKDEYVLYLENFVNKVVECMTKDFSQYVKGYSMSKLFVGAMMIEGTYVQDKQTAEKFLTQIYETTK